MNISKKTALVTGLLLMLSGFSALAQTTVYIVRHAEKVTKGNDDAAPLTELGVRHAKDLATFLQDKQITAIYISRLPRTRQTADPIAKTLQITPKDVAMNNPASVAADVKKEAGNTLVVGHSGSIPKLITALGVKDTVTIGECDYGDVFIVILGDHPTMTQDRYFDRK